MSGIKGSHYTAPRGEFRGSSDRMIVCFIGTVPRIAFLNKARSFPVSWINEGYTVVRICMVTAVLDRLKKAGAISGAMLVMSVGTVSQVPADGFDPLCDQPHIPDAVRDCWNPVEVAGIEGCHFRGALSPYHHAPPMTWSGGCRGGKAEGDGILEDNLGNRSEGRLVAGMKDGSWTTRNADGGVITETHVEGAVHGLWTFDFSASGGGFYVIDFKLGVRHGRWERHDPDEYHEIGTFEDGTRSGIWTITWPNGVEVLVPYVDGKAHGELRVTRDGTPIGALIYWKGRHVDGTLAPLPHFPGDP